MCCMNVFIFPSVNDMYIHKYIRHITLFRYALCRHILTVTEQLYSNYFGLK